MSSTHDKHKPHVIIVGAGLAGISAAIGLKRQLGIENFTIYDKGDDVGGTWRDNTYPGCGSDVGGHWYSLSTDLNPRWSSYFVNQPEIRAYWAELHRKYDLATHTVLGTAVHSCVWNPDTQVYSIVLEDVRTGVRTLTEAQVMIYAIGGFMSPMYPKDVPGANTFHGHVWHSARWNHDVALTGKRVGVIGNGCSAYAIYAAAAILCSE
ncbi:hypothetical protein BD779DRAFT_1189833 [Infundibulicybe gibba]|nr:hypothetical protein BD779DRAFT_1189833 [Infundibulicybe gibba]